jgi:hypothetical protein
MKTLLWCSLGALTFVVGQWGGIEGAEFDAYLDAVNGESVAAKPHEEPTAASTSVVEKASSDKALSDGTEASRCVCEGDSDLCLSTQSSCRTWTVDYRVRTMFDSHTTYEFGTEPVVGATPYAPLSRLVWPLDSTWHGLQIGVERPKWRAHFEWLTPMTESIYRDSADYDWSGADRPPASLSTSPTRWTDGQMLELEGAYKLTDHFCSLPIELWPMVGFRFQRFRVVAYDGVQLINDGTFGPDIPPVGNRWEGETINFCQQYYMGYLGGKLSTKLQLGQLKPTTLTFAGDWAPTAGYNVDHHISGYEKKGIHHYTMESTHGDAMHLALISETPLNRHLSIGLQADHTEIRTTGTHHFVETGTRSTNETWSNGVKVTSDQTSMTAFLRAQF